jgi:chloramphenicol-sensitive protein RarD
MPRRLETLVSEEMRGGLAALAAYLFWGVFPLYFSLLRAVPPMEVLAHRIIGSALFAFAVLAVTGGLRGALDFASNWRRVRPLLASSCAIAINWGLFIWAVTHGKALEASLGYFMFPLVSLVLARLVLGERLNRRRQTAAAIVAAGVAWLALAGAAFPWIALSLAISFGAYGLLRKTTPVAALSGLAIEAALLSPLALLYLISLDGGTGLALPPRTLVLLLSVGPATAIPLWLFAYGARRLRLSTLGLMMYINPAVQMLIAVFVLGELFTPVHAVAFGVIWSGLALYSWPEGRIGAPQDAEARMRAGE